MLLDREGERVSDGLRLAETEALSVALSVTETLALCDTLTEALRVSVSESLLVTAELTDGLLDWVSLLVTDEERDGLAEADRVRDPESEKLADALVD